MTTAKIKKDAVTSAKVKDTSLLAVDFASGQLPIGPKGDKGETGAKGEPGPTASAFAENSTGTALESSPTIINQVTITTTIQSRLIAQASIDVNGAAGANLYCFITDDPSLSSSKDWSVRTNDDFTDDLNTGVIGSKVLPPGTYTIFAACGKNGAPALEYIESDFAVIAAGS